MPFSARQLALPFGATPAEEIARLRANVDFLRGAIATAQTQLHEVAETLEEAWARTRP